MLHGVYHLCLAGLTGECFFLMAETLGWGVEPVLHLGQYFVLLTKQMDLLDGFSTVEVLVCGEEERLSCHS